MFLLRPASERGLADHGWLKSYHTFSFADYHDPRHMGFRALRVINEDRVQAGRGFGAHSHRDMEIISYVLEGGLRHKDSIGTGSVIRPGDVQRMSAGRGVLHSEFNHAADATTHFLQIWIEPSARGIDPGYEQRHFPDTEKRGRLRTVASPDGRDGSVTIHADASIHAALVDGDERIERALDPRRKTYVHVIRGSVEVNGQRLDAGDAAKLVDERVLTIARGDDAEVLVFDLAP
jgi:redox-sensitive bicupin YhaK (pirin superfamily)